MSAGHPPLARFVLIVGLAVRIGEKHGNRVFPSIDLISADTGIGQTTVKKWLRYLEEHGLIVREQTRRSDGTRGVNSYYLPIEATFRIKSTRDQQSESDLSESHSRKLSKPRSESDLTTVGIRPAEQESVEQDSDNKIQPLPVSDDESELPLGLTPLRPKDPPPADVASLVEEEWRARAFARPLRGGKLTPANAEKARNLARDAATEGQNALDVWREIFERIDDGAFLRGEIKPGEGFVQFQLKMDWLLEKRNFTKVLEGRYDGKSTGPSIKRGSTSEAAGRVIERLRASGRERTGRGNPGLSDGR